MDVRDRAAAAIRATLIAQGVTWTINGAAYTLADAVLAAITPDYVRTRDGRVYQMSDLSAVYRVPR